MANELRKFIDTNVFVYAEDLDDVQKHQRAINVIKQLTGEGNGVTSMQIFAEFSRVLNGAMKPGEINQRISDYQNVFQEVIEYSIGDIKKANELADAYGIHFFDALIAATMNSHNIDIIITENEKDFKKLPWIKIVNPFK